MNIHFAGNSGFESREKIWLELTGTRLLSYWYINEELFFADGAFNLIKERNMKRTKDKAVDLFLDSGAFSAWSKGAEIDIQEYIEFIKEHEDTIEVYANLDVISTGKTGDKESAEKTLENQRIMEEAGLNPLPVFHYGEPMEYLEHYIENYDYFSLGGMVPISTSQLHHWLNDLWGNYLTDEAGNPLVKIHGFGLTSLSLMIKYPWYSVDSTSWVVTGRLGSIYVPRFRDGDFIYDENSWKVTVSNKSPGIKDRGKHIDTMPKNIRKIILDYIHDKGYKLGKSEFKTVSKDHELAENEKWAESKKDATGDTRKLEVIVEPGISNIYQLRDEMNIMYFMDLEKHLPDWPWKYEKKRTNSKLF